MLINCSLSFYRSRAPALCNLSEDTRIIPADIQGVLGPIPHTIRGFLHSYQSVAPTCAKFKQCIACSETVIDKYRKEGVEFVFKVLNSGSYLEEVTGLSELQLTAEMCDVSLFVVVYIMSARLCFAQGRSEVRGTAVLPKNDIGMFTNLKSRSF